MGPIWDQYGINMGPYNVQNGTIKGQKSTKWDHKGTKTPKITKMIKWDQNWLSKDCGIFTYILGEVLRF